MRYFKIYCAGLSLQDESPWKPVGSDWPVMLSVSEYPARFILNGEMKSGGILGAFVRDHRLTPADIENYVREFMRERMGEKPVEDEWMIAYGKHPEGVPQKFPLSAEEVSAENLLRHTYVRRDAHRANLSELYNLFFPAVGKNTLLFCDLATENPRDWDVLGKEAEKTPYSLDLGGEISRIKASQNRQGTESGFPDTTEKGENWQAAFEYAIEVESIAEANSAGDLLLEALNRAGRLGNRNVFTLDLYEQQNSFIEYEKISDEINANLFRSLEKSTLVIDYSRQKEGSDSELRAAAVLRKILDCANKYPRRVQLIFLIGAAERNIAARLEHTLNVPLVTLRRNPAQKFAVTDLRRARTETAHRLRRCGFVMDKRAMRSLDAVIEAAAADKSSRKDPQTLANRWITKHNLETDFAEYRAVVGEPRGMRDKTDAMEELNKLIGLEEVKKEIRMVLDSFRIGQIARRAGLADSDISLHSVFVGSPGTGKTEVAQLYGRILKEMGVLSEGRVFRVSGTHLGTGTPGETNRIDRLFAHAKGSVIFIDEAYTLSGRSETVAELIAQMENHRRDTVVIFAGYQKAMEQLLNTNPGFRSRIGSIIKFPDYTPEELGKIFDFMLEKQGLKITRCARRAVRDRLAAAGMKPEQGNARFVRNLVADIQRNQRVRLAQGENDSALTKTQLTTLIKEDVPHCESDTLPSGTLRLSRLIGLKSVKNEVMRQLYFAQNRKMRRDAGLSTHFVPMHMVFAGNPGTGKTEVARLVGQIARERELLAIGNFFEVSRRDLIGNPMVSTAALVESVFQKARGSVLFIDEAYTLNDDGEGRVAIDAMVKHMEDMREEIIVIMAGYTAEMKLMLQANPGFASRVRTTVDFPDYSRFELFEILMSHAREKKYRFTDAARRKARELLEKAEIGPNSGNGRLARQMLEECILEQAVRLQKRAAHGLKPTVRELETLRPADVVLNTGHLGLPPRIGFRVD